MDNETVGVVLTIALAIAFVFIYVGSIGWAYRDASGRGKSGCLVAFLVWFFWPIGLLVWIALRPETGRKIE